MTENGPIFNGYNGKCFLRICTLGVGSTGSQCINLGTRSSGLAQALDFNMGYCLLRTNKEEEYEAWV